MGLLNSVLGALGTAQGGAAQGDALRAMVSLLARDTQGRTPVGLDGLVQRFEQRGLGELVASWIGTGHNLPVSAEQLHAVLGAEWVGQFARQLGLPRDDAAQQLSQLLPQMVDRLTPDGQLPNTGVSGFGDLGSVLVHFTRH